MKSEKKVRKKWKTSKKKLNKEHHISEWNVNKFTKKHKYQIIISNNNIKLSKLQKNFLLCDFQIQTYFFSDNFEFSTMSTSKKEYFLQKKTVAVWAQRQTLKEFDLILHKTDQADCKIKHNAVQCLKKTSKW